jgi:ribosomal protein S18 acetylase RimI-like enzyme
MHLRPATPEDAEAVAAIWSAGWVDGHLGNVPDELVAVRTPESFATRAPQRVGDTTVAEVDGVVVGFTMVHGDEVDQVYVAPAARGSGVAAALLDEAAQRIAAAGHARAWLAVVPGNARARRFYERQGWRDEGLFTLDASGVPTPCHRYVRDVDVRDPGPGG